MKLIPAMITIAPAIMISHGDTAKPLFVIGVASLLDVVPVEADVST